MSLGPKSKTDGTASSAILATGVQVASQALTLFVAYRIGVSLFGLSVLGVWSIASASTTFGRLGDLGLAGAVPRLVAGHDGAGTCGRIPELIETAALAVAAGVIVLALIIFYPLFAFMRGITTPEAMPLLLPLLIGANLALVCTGIGAAFLGCLDGLGAFRARAIISVVSVIANPATVYASGKLLGPISLALGAIVQASLTVVFGWLALRARVDGLSVVPVVWSRTAFKELLGVGKFTQANSVLIMLFEPASRMLAGRWGGLEFAAIFDFAARVSANLRLLFSSLSQTLVPFHANLRDRPKDAQRLFISSTLLTAATAAIVSAMALAMAPLLSLFSLTAVDSRFLGTFGLLLLGNLVNVIGGPGYAYTLGGGAVSVTTKALGLQAAVFLVLAGILETAAVDDGITVAYSAAVSVSGLFLLFVANRDLAIGNQAVIQQGMLAASPSAFALAVFAFLFLSDDLAGKLPITTAIPAVGLGVAVLVTTINFRLIKQTTSEILLFRMNSSTSH